MLTKDEACQRLNCKPRTLELYTQQGKLSVHYGKGQRGKIALYDENEVEALAREIEQGNAYAQRPALALEKVANPANQIASIEPMIKLVEMLAKPRTDIAEFNLKLTLSLDEACQLSGLPRSMLRRAIDEKKLKAIRTGRGFRVRRADLESYIKKL
jgi:excisionase family DNA binding protein